MIRLPAGRRLATNILIFLVCYALAWSASHFPALELLEQKTVDWRMHLRGELPVSDDLTVIVIDSATVAEYHTHPIPREQIALLIGQLQEVGARVIGVDLLFEGYSQEGSAANFSDSVLWMVSAECPNLVHGVELAVDSRVDDSIATWAAGQKRHALASNLDKAGLRLFSNIPADSYFPFPELWEVTPSFGNMAVVPDSDLVVRQTPLVTAMDGALFPSFALAILKQWCGEDAEIEIQADELTISGSHDSLTMPIDTRGQIRINWSGPADRFTRYSFLNTTQYLAQTALTAQAEAKAAFAGKIVLIGVTAGVPNFSDQGPTPFVDSEPGVYIHANIISSALTGQYLRDITGSGLHLITLILFGILGISMSIARPIWKSIAVCLIIAAYPLGIYLLFINSGLVLPLMWPLIGGFLGILLNVGVNSLLRHDRLHILQRKLGQEILNFDARFETRNEKYQIKILESPAGEPAENFHLDITHDDLEQLRWYLNPRRREESKEEALERARTFGGKLYETVFTGEVRGVLQSSLDEVRRRGYAGLRIRLRLSDTPELVVLPWELLYNQARNQFLSLSGSTPIVRYQELASIIQPLAVGLPLRIMVVFASPEGYPQLDIRREWASIQHACTPLIAGGLIRIDQLESPTLAGLQDIIRERPFHILHFVGHGVYDELTQAGSLVFENDDQTPHLVSGETLGVLLHDSRVLRLAILNACEGAMTSVGNSFAGVAQNLVQQGIPAVIGMQFEISDAAAGTFSRELYAQIVRGIPLDLALAETRRRMFAADNSAEWWAPVLYLRAKDGRIFDIDK